MCSVSANPQDEEESTTTESSKRRQYLPAAPGVYPAPGYGFPAAPALPVAPAPGPIVAPVGQCPGGPSLPVECDPKRPWPQCPPQSYCYATNSVDIGPYFCCPIWSTYGAAWRPATPFYNYVPPPPPNWPDVARLTANWPTAAIGLPVGFAPARPFKSKKEQNFENENLTSEDQQKIEHSVNDWVRRQAKSL